MLLSSAEVFWCLMFTSFANKHVTPSYGMGLPLTDGKGIYSTSNKADATMGPEWSLL